MRGIVSIGLYLCEPPLTPTIFFLPAQAQGGSDRAGWSPPYLQFVDQHSDGIELIAGGCRVGHDERGIFGRGGARIAGEEAG